MRKLLAAIVFVVAAAVPAAASASVGVKHQSQLDGLRRTHGLGSRARLHDSVLLVAPCPQRLAHGRGASHLRLRRQGAAATSAVRWITTRSTLRPESYDEFAFATPFSIQGRATREVVAEFGHDLGWSPDPASGHLVRLQAKVHPSNEMERLRGV
jgi:hypothetical protein